MKTKILLACGAVAVMAALPLACKSNVPPENPQPFVPTADGGAVPTSTVVTPTDTADAGAPAADAAASPIQPVFDAAAQELLKTALKPLQQKHAPGMKPDSQIFGGMINEGQTVEQQATLMPGKCYTIVGTSLAGIEELDISVNILTPLPTLSPLLAVDGMTGPQAIVAGSPNCYKIPPIMMIATPVKIIIKATKGSGIAGAQMYAK